MCVCFNRAERALISAFRKMPISEQQDFSAFMEALARNDFENAEFLSSPYRWKTVLNGILTLSDGE